MKSVTSISHSSSAPVDSNDGNDVDMNTFIVPDLVKPNAENNALISIYIKDYLKEKLEEKEEGRREGTIRREERKISMGKFLSRVSGALGRKIHSSSHSVWSWFLRDIEIPVAAEAIFFF